MHSRRMIRSYLNLPVQALRMEIIPAPSSDRAAECHGLADFVRVEADEAALFGGQWELDAHFFYFHHLDFRVCSFDAQVARQRGHHAAHLRGRRAVLEGLSYCSEEPQFFVGGVVRRDLVQAYRARSRARHGGAAGVVVEAPQSRHRQRQLRGPQHRRPGRQLPVLVRARRYHHRLQRR